MRILTVLFALLVAVVPVTAEDEKAPAPPRKPDKPEKVEKAEPEVHETASGIRYWILKPGKGARPRPGDEVSVHYAGRLKSGVQFDSSYVRGTPFTFMLGTGGVIAGWDEGVALMNVGAKYRFHIPAKLAYGANPPRGSAISPNSDLIFEIELLAIKEGTPLPEFRKGNPEKQQKTESGLVWEVLKEGKGELPRKDQGVRMRFAVWSKDGKYSVSTEGTPTAGIPIKLYLCGLRDEAVLASFKLPFIREAAAMMRPGTVLRLEVPAALAFGNKQAPLPNIEPGAVSVWEVEMLTVQDVPKFRKLDEAKTKTTASGLQYEVVRAGEGTRKPTTANTVEVRYSGWTTDGKMFDSSHARGDTATFGLRRVIRGWTEGLPLMNEGGIYLFRIPWNLAYGERGSPPAIGPKADLIFLVELVRVVK
ncbi:MAG: FKBP-type peptidyl-prolyl cis-trans isomerase [Planctomycetota bacterium]